MERHMRSQRSTTIQLMMMTIKSGVPLHLLKNWETERENIVWWEWDNTIWERVSIDTPRYWSDLRSVDPWSTITAVSSSTLLPSAVKCDIDCSINSRRDRDSHMARLKSHSSSVQCPIIRPFALFIPPNGRETNQHNRCEACQSAYNVPPMILTTNSLF